MPTDSKPTNEAIIGLLERILAEIGNLEDGRGEIAGDIRRLADTAGE